VGKPIQYRFDLRTSRFTIKAFAGGMLSAIGHNPVFAVRDYSGQARFDPESGDGASLSVVIKAASLEVTNESSSKDRQEIEQVMREEVLETERFQEIRFECPAAQLRRSGEGQFDVTLPGTMTLHGLSRPETIHARVVANASMLHAFGEFSLSQQQYGITLVSVAGGTLKVKDQLQCVFDIVARP